jgi:hypothetical protein
MRQEILALDQLHDESADVLRFFDAVYRGDGGVIERRQRLRFAREPGQAIGIAGEGATKDLQRNVAIQLSVVCAIHLAYMPPAPKKTGNVHDWLNPRCLCGSSRILRLEFGSFMSVALDLPPTIGEIVRVRSRRYLVEEVRAPPTPGDDTLVRLSCLEIQRFTGERSTIAVEIV